jgi:hypothetical protein
VVYDLKVANELNALRYLYLTDIGEPEDNVLRLVVTEGRVADEPSQADLAAFRDLGRLASGARSIVVDEVSASYELTFGTYIAYAVMNESFTVANESEVYTGHLFRTYSKSAFLEYVAAATIASDDYGGPYVHYGLVCLNHIVEVASAAPPRIVRLR